MLAQESAARQIVFGKRWLVLSAFVIFAAILGSIAPARSLAIVLQAASATVGLAVLVNFVVALRRQRVQRAQRTAAKTTMADDPNPCVLTTQEGDIVAQNNVALTTFLRPAQPTIADLLAPLFADPEALSSRLAAKATEGGAAKEDINTRDGTMRLSAHRVGEDLFWRLETLWDAAENGAGTSDHGLPMVMASNSNVILFMNAAARSLVGRRESKKS